MVIEEFKSSINLLGDKTLNRVLSDRKIFMLQDPSIKYDACTAPNGLFSLSINILTKFEVMYSIEISKYQDQLVCIGHYANHPDETKHKIIDNYKTNILEYILSDTKELIYNGSIYKLIN